MWGGEWQKRGRYVEARSVRKWRVHGKWSITRYCPVCHASGWPHLHKHDVVRGQKFQLGYFAREWRVRIDFPRAPRQHRKRKTPLDIAEELKLVSWQGRILVSCAVPRRVEFPRVPHVYPHADFCVGIFFFLNGCKEEIFKVFFFFC